MAADGLPVVYFFVKINQVVKSSQNFDTSLGTF